MTDRTNLEKLIKAERKKAAAKIAKLKRDAAAEQRKVDAKVVLLLREQKPDLYASLEGAARAALDAERAQRSRKAKRAATELAAETVSTAAASPKHNEGAGHPWNG